jgi:hypothetical protein
MSSTVVTDVGIEHTCIGYVFLTPVNVIGQACSTFAVGAVIIHIQGEVRVSWNPWAKNRIDIFEQGYVPHIVSKHFLEGVFVSIVTVNPELVGGVYLPAKS